jgi:hypothetical protein
MEKILERIFNTNKDYFIKSVVYEYEGKSEIGYVLCKGYILFGIKGYKRIGYFVEKNEADAKLKIMKL